MVLNFLFCCEQEGQRTKSFYFVVDYRNRFRNEGFLTDLEDPYFRHSQCCRPARHSGLTNHCIFSCKLNKALHCNIFSMHILFKSYENVI